MPPVNSSTAVDLNAAAAASRSNLSLVSSTTRPTLRQGSRGAAVEELQSKLTQRGYSPGAVDGVFGRRTKTAVTGFQRSEGLSIDGIVGRRTWAALDGGQPATSVNNGTDTYTPPASSASSGLSTQPTLRRGARGIAVTRLQGKLSDLGYSPGRADGIFGSRTTSAVRSFQGNNDLSSDGVVGPRTWSALNSPNARPASAGSTSGSTPTGRGTASDFVSHALAQQGDRYVYGAETRSSDPNPNTFDCSELVEWAAARTGVSVPDGSANQQDFVRRHGTQIPVSQALRTRGALLFRPGHVAISLGDGRTIEARGRSYGVGIFSAQGRFTSAGLVPGMRY